MVLPDAGNGSFTGKYNGGDFSFYRTDLAKKPVCDVLAIADADTAQARAAYRALVAGEAADEAESVAPGTAYAADARSAADKAQATYADAQAVYNSLKKNCP